MITEHLDLTKFTNGKCLSARIVRENLKFADDKVDIEHRTWKVNAVFEALSHNPQGCVDVVE